MPTWLVIGVCAWLGLAIGVFVVLLVDHLLRVAQLAAAAVTEDTDTEVQRATADLDAEIRELLGGAR